MFSPCTSALVSLTLAAMSVVAADPKQTCTLRTARQPGVTDHVVVAVEIGGDITASENDKIQRRKMSVVANLAYDERTLPAPAGTKEALRSVRYYDRADAVLKVDDGGFKPTLGQQQRLIGVKVDNSKPVLFHPSGPLTQEELDLIDVAGNSLLVDQLLPANPVALGDTWQVPDPLVAGLLGLDAVKYADVKCTLTEVTDKVARFEMTGDVEGASCGVSTEIGLKGKFRFDRHTNRIDWLALLIRQRQDIGHVMQGLDAVARVQVDVTPNASSSHLADAALRGINLEPKNDQLALVFRPKRGDWQFLYDRRWAINGADHDLAVLRLVDRGELVAQCNVSPLAKVKPGNQQTLDTFQKDIKQALGDQFGEFVAASQSANDLDYRVLRVVVRGLVSELPIEWHYYLVADKQGRQIVFVFTVEGKLAGRLGNADKELIAGLRFLNAKLAMGTGASRPPDEKR